MINSTLVMALLTKTVKSTLNDSSKFFACVVSVCNGDLNSLFLCVYNLGLIV